MVAFAALTALVLTACGSGGNAEPGSEDAASSYPDGKLEYVIPYKPGGSTDPAGREFSRLLAEELGTSAVAENLPGGDETIGLASVIDAEPNGMRLGISSATGIVVQPMVNPDLTWKGIDDYTPVAKMLEAPNILVVGKDSPYETLDDLIADAKARPGEVRVGTTGRLTNNSFVIATLEKQADVELTIVPFSGGAGEAVLATMSGEVEAAVPTAAAQLGLVESGDLRVLAHTGDERYDDVAQGPSFESLGFDVPYSSDYVTIAAPGLPDDVRTKLVAAALAVAKSDEWAAFCEKSGFVADPMADDELVAWIEKTTTASDEGIKLMDARE
ncbi:Bug family tripartite tricarboxylate transporter substrate binding protein [Microbacterium sp. NPDC058342]|uniref:Bug family tripartite tricarboxylate transporter substrate binding protein n=1 Tax=Microbacterium sp. NPDC058342 TaxID=3346454 RepID=UPI00364C87FC